MEKEIELCIRDEQGRIVAWQVGYSDEELDDLLKRHPGWHRSHAEYTMEGLR